MSSAWSHQGQLEYALETEFILNRLKRDDLDDGHRELVKSIRAVIDPIIG
jgi:hypothetical protein